MLARAPRHAITFARIYRLLSLFHFLTSTPSAFRFLLPSYSRFPSRLHADGDICHALTLLTLSHFELRAPPEVLTPASLRYTPSRRMFTTNTATTAIVYVTPMFHHVRGKVTSLLLTLFAPLRCFSEGCQSCRCATTPRSPVSSAAMLALLLRYHARYALERAADIRAIDHAAICWRRKMMEITLKPDIITMLRHAVFADAAFAAAFAAMLRWIFRTFCRYNTHTDVSRYKAILFSPLLPCQMFATIFSPCRDMLPHMPCRAKRLLLRYDAADAPPRFRAATHAALTLMPLLMP